MTDWKLENYYETIIDNDIDIGRIMSDNLKVLCCKYDSLFFGDHDNVDDIHFIDKKRRFFFSFSDAITPIYADCRYLNEEDRSGEGNEYAFMSPILRCVYVLKGYRGMGIQKEIFESINEVSEETSEPYIAIADPFKITKSVYENCPKRALYNFLMNGYERPSTWENDVKIQCAKFGKYNLQRFVLPEYELTKPFQHYIYVPHTANKGIKLAVRSIQEANNLETLDI